MVDLLGEREDLSAELYADVVEVELVVHGDEADSEAEVSKAAGPAYSVEVSLSVGGEVKVDDDVYGLDVYAASAEVRGDEVSAVSAPELVEYFLAVLHRHARVNVERRVSHLCDGFCEAFYALYRVAEYHRLVDAEVVKESAEAMKLLALLHKGVVLRDAL